jgi:hypothetical protein
LSDRSRLLDLATDLVKAEGDNWAGRVNLLGMAALFLLIFLPAAALDLIQVVVRWFKPHYETDLPSTLSMLLTYGFLLLACVGILALSEVLRTKRSQ